MTATRSHRRTTNPNGGSGNRIFAALLLLLVVGGLFAVAVLATNRSSSVTAEQVADVTISGTPLSPLPAGLSITDPSTDPMAGQLAPTITGTNFDGDAVTIEPDGRAKAIYFVAHWCPHCREEVPVLRDLIAGDRLPGDVDVYAVSTAVDAGAANYPPQRWLSGEGFDQPTVRDNARSEAFAVFGGTGYPYAVYLDAEHRVVARSAGQVGPDALESLWQMAAAAS